MTAVLEATGNRFEAVTDELGRYRIPVRVGGYVFTVDLHALLAPGSRTSSTNANSPLPDRNGGEVREYQTNLDGMQVTNSLGGGSQPRFSQEMIAEFQFISNRFDATQGRSQGVQVNVVTKSGTNRFSGSFRGNFRDDRFNAEDPALERKVPITNQQLASTFGGPIRRDRLHFFAFHEYEREPRSSIWNTPFPRFNIEMHGTVTRKMGGGRLDLPDLSTDPADVQGQPDQDL